MNIKSLKTIKCDQGAVRAVRFNVDGSYCLTCGGDKKLKLWNPHKALHLKTYGGHGNEVLDACGSCDNSQIVSCGADTSVIQWDVSTGQIVRRFRGHAGRANCVKFNEDSSVAVSGAQDNTIMFWDMRSRKNDPMQVLREAKDGITSVQVTDHEILSGSLDCFVRSYDIRAGKVVSDFLGESVTCVNFTRDEQCMLVSCADSTIRLLDRESGELLSEFQGHRTGDYVIESCMNHKDSHVLSGSTDGLLYMWELVTGTVTTFGFKGSQPLHSISPHSSRECFLTACGGDITLWGTQEQTDDDDDNES